MELGLRVLLTLSVKHNRKKNKVSAKFNLGLNRFYSVTFKQLVRSELLFSILSSFSESEPLSK